MLFFILFSLVKPDKNSTKKFTKVSKNNNIVVRENALILQFIEEFKLWLKEIKGGSEEVREDRWKEIFSDLKNFANYDDIEEIKKFVEEGTGERKGWSSSDYFFDKSESKYLLEFLEVRKYNSVTTENLEEGLRGRERERERDKF